MATDLIHSGRDPIDPRANPAAYRPWGKIGRFRRDRVSSAPEPSGAGPLTPRDKTPLIVAGLLLWLVALVATLALLGSPADEPSGGDGPPLTGPPALATPPEGPNRNQ